MEKQHELFERQPEPWELDDAADAVVASVVFSQPPFGPFDYRVPDSLGGNVEPGRRVRVPLGRGNRPVVGYCTNVASQSIQSAKLKDVKSVVDQTTLLSPAMLRLTAWISEYYHCPLGQVLDTVVPAPVRGQAGTREQLFLSVTTSVAARLTQLKLPPKQAQVLRILAASPQPLTPFALAQTANCTQGPINELRRKNLIKTTTQRVYQKTMQVDADVQREDHHALNDDQQRALDAILDMVHSGKHQAALIHGVTGSGKTEVYIRAIEAVLRFGRQAIVLVPEISLTPQTCARFRSRFEHVAVLHSHQSPAERHWHWQQIAQGNIQVVVGARSAVFAPTPHLGLIVLDEEHDGSFKQETAPRYHARDVALRRAEGEQISLVLGSATPSLESWHASSCGQFRRLRMPRRVFDRPLPKVGTIDLRTEFRNRSNRGAISRQLQSAMQRTLEDDGQIILLLNRRGYSTTIQCPACGHVVNCPHCELPLTHHREGEKAVCHYCDYRMVTPAGCPACGFDGIRFSGLGTQRLEAEVRGRFRGVPCLRMDSDSMQSPGSHDQALARFRSGAVKILLGTQMIAKGLDIPNVTLVGVINADTGLHFPDFRAAERTFQLVTQVAGRTGRGEKGGSVLVQTFSPEHFAIQTALQHDYEMFVNREMPIRKEFGYPPFASLVRVIMRGPSVSGVAQFADHFADQIRTHANAHEQAIQILGPAPAPIAKIRGNYRFHLLLKGEQKTLSAIVDATSVELGSPSDVLWVTDVDPVSLL